MCIAHNTRQFHQINLALRVFTEERYSSEKFLLSFNLIFTEYYFYNGNCDWVFNLIKMCYGVCVLLFLCLFVVYI